MALKFNFNKDSTLGTVGVVAVLCLACSIVVSVSAVGLRPFQEANKALDKQSNIVAVAGFDTENVGETYAKRIDARMLDLATGNFIEGDANKFDIKAAAKDPKTNLVLGAGQDPAGIKQISKVQSIFLAKSEAGAIESVIMPIYGQGLWSTMYGFIALSPDGQAVKGITFYEHGETPGLGAEISNPKWQALFVGKKLFDANGAIALKIIKGSAPAGSEHEIDGISGSTLTGNGVQRTIEFWMGQQGYGPFLAKLKAGEIK